MPHFLALRPPDQLGEVLRGLGGFDAVGPHITVKAQPGLEDHRRSEWLPRVRRALAGFGSFSVQLGSVGSFGDDVACLEVGADEVPELHRRLVDAVRPPAALAARHFELEGWHPHLTLRQGRGVDLDDVRAGVARLGPLPAFTVDQVWLCRQDASGAVPAEAISLL